jgi:hypothetical protein
MSAPRARAGGLLAGALWPGVAAAADGGTIAASAAFAAVVAIGATVAIERFGGRLGGVLGTLPTTIVPASLGLWASRGGDAAFADALAAVPGGMLVNAWFLWTWRALPPRLPHLALGPRLALMTAASLAAWAAGAAAWTWLLAGPLAGVPAPARAALGLALLAAAGLIATNTPAPAPRGRRAVGPVALAGRGVLAAAAIALAVALGSSGFPLLAGMASVFPAIFLTTMVSLWLAQGEAVPLGAVGPMILGSSAVALYATFALFSFPALGPGLGAAAAWTGAVMVGSWPAATRLRRRSKP